MKAKASREDKRVVLKKGRFFHFVRKGEWEYFERSNCTGIVIIIAMTDDKKVIFVEQFRPPSGCNVIEFPAGLVNDQNNVKKESLVTAAKREFLEEVGYKARSMKQVISGPVSAGSSSDQVVMFRALNIQKVAAGGGDDMESILVHEVPLNDVDGWLKRMQKLGKLIEPKIYTGLYFLKNGTI